jgi:hypothetical protein
VSANELELSALGRHHDETSARFDSALAEVRDTFAALPEPPSAVELDARLGPLRAEVEGLANRLIESQTLVSERHDREASATQDVERLVAQLAARVDQLERGRDVRAGEIARSSEAWAEERTWVRERLDSLVTAVAETPSKQDVERLVADLSGRLHELDSERTTLTAEIARTEEASAAEKEQLAARVAEISSWGPPTPPSEDPELKGLLIAFADRIEAMEQDRATVVNEAARAFDDGLSRFRTLLDDVGSRLAAAEQELATRAGSHALARLDELASRMDSLEGVGAPPLAATSAAAGDGRYRVELRVLELRMQHAEAAARENREAVLVELERLASRVEWRLQRLEAEQTSEPEEPGERVELGLVVPIRGSGET